MTPIAVGPVSVDDVVHGPAHDPLPPSVPVPAGELERWLGQQVSELLAEALQATVRMSRLPQGRPSADLEIAWLVELELAEGEPLLAWHGLADALRDMPLLGLQPTPLAPRDAWTNGRAT